jgi:CheY-like chemotaxis protein
MGAKILSAEGHQVTTVSNGQAAIRSLEQTEPDLVVADIFMPGRNGYEVCHFIKTDARLKNIPVLLIIGAMEPYDPEEGRRARADALITKPLESSNLVTTVQGLLSNSKRSEALNESGLAVAAPGGPGEEAPTWDESEDEAMAPPTEALVIPQEMSQQPVGMLTDLLPSPVSSAPPVAVEPPPMPFTEPVQLQEAVAAFESAVVSESLVEEAVLPNVQMAEQPSPQIVWTAEPAVLTPEEEELFQQSAGSLGDWTSLVEQNAPDPVQQDRQLETSLSTEEIAAPPADEAQVEHFDSLDGVTAAETVKFSDIATPETDAVSEALAEPFQPAEPMPALEPVPTPAPDAVHAMVLESAEELAAEPDPPMPDYVTLEHIVRGVVGEMMPQIVSRVKQALRS